MPTTLISDGRGGVPRDALFEDVEPAVLDAVLHPLQALQPEWGRGLDRQPEVAARPRRNLLALAADQGIPVAAAHLEGLFQVEPSGSAFRLVPV